MRIFLKIAAIIAILAVSGCKASVKWYRPETGPVKTNDTVRAFQDERYIWENWEYGTNRVDSAGGK